MVDTGLAIYRRHVESDDTTGYIAHLLGAVAGLAIGIIVLRNRKVESWEVWLKWICVVGFLLATLASVLWNIYASDGYYLEQNYNTTTVQCQLWTIRL